MSNAFENMDRMYRHQRYFYDLTRKYYLLGRDNLIARINVNSGENILEVGCGTARNLIVLAQKHQKANFFGLDASSEMLKTSQEKIDAENLENVRLQVALADNYTFRETFGLNQPFDAVYFSYSISMIPAWRESIRNALDNLKGGGSFHIVDFYDQADLPKWFQKMLQSWLKRFHVKYPKELLPHLGSLEKQNLGTLKITPLYRRYSFIAEFRKN